MEIRLAKYLELKGVAKRLSATYYEKEVKISSKRARKRILITQDFILTLSEKQ